MKSIIINSDSKFVIYKRVIKKIFYDLSKYLKFDINRIEVSFVNDEIIKRINKKYLNHDFATDIITFDYSENGSIDCELIISYKTAFDNSNKFNVDFNSEIVRLLIHGILHVTGYDDKNSRDKIKMKKKENALVKKFSDKYWVLKNDN